MLLWNFSDFTISSGCCSKEHLCGCLLFGNPMILRLGIDWYMTMSFHFFIYTLQLIYIKRNDAEIWRNLTNWDLFSYVRQNMKEKVYICVPHFVALDYVHVWSRLIVDKDHMRLCRFCWLIEELMMLMMLTHIELDIVKLF